MAGWPGLACWLLASWLVGWLAADCARWASQPGWLSELMENSMVANLRYRLAVRPEVFLIVELGCCFLAYIYVAVRQFMHRGDMAGTPYGLGMWKSP